MPTTLVVRQPDRRDAVALGIIIAAFLIQWAIFFGLRFVLETPDGIWQMHTQVLAGAAPASYQYQMWVHDHLLGALFRLLPVQTPAAFVLLYDVYYGIGGVLFVALLYRLCRRVASPAASALALLYLVAIFPIMWYDSYYHPGDPWGAAVAAVIVGLVLDGRAGLPLYLAYTVSGFIWEKVALIPLTVGADAIRGDRRGWVRHGAVAALGAFLAVLGQLLPRWIYGTHRPVAGISLMENVVQLPLYAVSMCVVYGAPLWFILRRRERVPPLFRALALQFLLWPIIYLVMAGVLKEMRGILVMVPCMWPVFALCLDDCLCAPAGAPAAPIIAGRTAPRT